METLKPLTDKEKFQCVVRWLNRFYRAYVTQTCFENPCESCPVRHEKCDRHAQCLPSENFEILEQFTGKDTVINACLTKKCL